MEKSTHRKPYVIPRLKEHGLVRDLTQSSTGSMGKKGRGKGRGRGMSKGRRRGRP